MNYAFLFMAIVLGGCTTTFIRGSHGIENLHEVEYGLWRGGEPDANGWQWLLTEGFCRVQLDYNNERRASPPGGMVVIEVPMPPSDSDDLLKGPTREQVLTAVQAIQDAKIKCKKVIVGCLHGRDRTGLVIGAYKIFVWGWSKRQAWDEAVKLGYRWELIGLDMAWERL